ncbi:MAG: AsmA family protein [Acidobacteria bacterium]|nr:AsmA family protein [Acidobacteriota bacterium]
MKRKILLGILFLALGAVAVTPFLKADHHRGRIQQALESALHRRVEILGKVTYSLWNGPGFSIADVVIHEDPAVGMEPFAYVAVLDARIDVLAALQGRWEVNSILLDEPRVNVVKRETGAWNVRPFLVRPPSGIQAKLPVIRVRSGRINLRFGDTKSALYLTNAEVDISASGGSAIDVRFSAEPARTDRIAQGFGTLEGRGQYRWSAGSPSELDFDLELERSALTEAVTLLGGPGAGMRGFIASKAKVKGPLSALRIEGSARLEEVQRFGLLSTGSGNWPIQYKGTFDFPAGELDLVTSNQARSVPFRIRLRAHSLLNNPSWGAIAEFSQLPVGDLRELFQHMDVSLPSRVSLDGKLSGVLGYSRNYGLQGVLEMPEASVKSGDSVVAARGMRFTIDGQAFRLSPTTIDLGEGRTAEVEGAYNPSAQSLVWRTQSPTPVTAFLATQRQLLGQAEIPLLDRLEGGEWQGTVGYTKAGDQPDTWNGSFTLTKSRIPVQGLSAPLQVESARVSILVNRLQIEAINGTVEGLVFAASFRQGPSRARPDRLQITIEQAEVAALEQVFLPSLKRTSGILGRLSLRNQTAPEWLRNRHLQAAIQIADLRAGETRLGQLRTTALWDGLQVDLEDLQWQREEASASGSARISLARLEPQYTVNAEIKNLPWRGGTIGAETAIETSGTGLALVRNAKSSGKFQARSLDFSPENDFLTVSGTYEYSSPRGLPLLKLQAIEANSNGEVYTGQGASESDGKLSVELAAGRKRTKMTGQLWPFQLDVAR